MLLAIFGFAQDVAQPLLYMNVKLPKGGKNELYVFFKERERARMVTKSVLIPHYYDDFGTTGMLTVLLGLLPRLERLSHAHSRLWLHEALMLKHSSGDSLLHLRIRLDESQEHVSDILSLVGHFHRLKTLHIEVRYGHGDVEVQPIAPITLPALRTLKYELDCEISMSPWVRFLGDSEFPDLRTLVLMANPFDADEAVSLCHVGTLLEQLPLLQRLEADVTLTNLRELLVPSLSVRELVVDVTATDDPDVTVLTLPATITTLELYQPTITTLEPYQEEGGFFRGEVQVVRAICAGLAAHAYSQLRCIRLSATWGVILPQSVLMLRKAKRANAALMLSTTKLADAMNVLQRLWRARDLGKFGVTLHDRDGKRIEEGKKGSVRIAVAGLIFFASLAECTMILVYLTIKLSVSRRGGACSDRLHTTVSLPLVGQIQRSPALRAWCNRRVALDALFLEFQKGANVSMFL
jgi:hypothetical protein